MIIGNGEYQYEVVKDWLRLPPEIRLGDVAAVAVDERDHVFLFTRGDHPVIVVDREGDVLRTWGHGLFTRPHGIHFGHDGAVYCTDDNGHCVRKCSPEGELLLTLGLPGEPAPFMSNTPFHRCTHTALSPAGDIYVSDGYGNACVHKFDPSGRWLNTWGGSGAGRGEFYVPHNLVCDEQGWVYVADRENHRIQVFDGNGRYETQWNNMHRPCALCRGSDRLFYVGEVGPALWNRLDYPNLGPRVTILDERGEAVARLSAGAAGIGPGRFIAPHGIAVDSRGDIYVAEVSNVAWAEVLPNDPRPDFIPSLHKLRRVAVCQSEAP